MITPREATYRKEILKRRKTKLWEQRITEAQEKGWFTTEDSELCHQWCGCAVGEVCGLKASDDTHELESRISGLGLDFTSCVVCNDPPQALKTLKSIRQANEDLVDQGLTALGKALG